MLYEIRNARSGHIYTKLADLRKVVEVLGEKREQEVRDLSEGDEIECVIKNMKNFKVAVRKLPFDENPAA